MQNNEIKTMLESNLRYIDLNSATIFYNIPVGIIYLIVSIYTN